MPHKFSGSLDKVGQVKNHRNARSAKIEIRANVLREIGQGARVFDAFAGAGEMYREVWSHAADYVGCDTDWYHDGRTAFVCDNRRVLRSIDLDPFTIFDLDAYGSPWEQVLIIAARRDVDRGERIGIVLTDGSGMAMKQGGMPKALAQLTGMRMRMPGLPRWQDDITNRAISGMASKMGCKISRRWSATGRTGVSVRYTGLVLEGL